MEKTRKITQYRERLDKTLASPNLTNTEALKTLVKNQLIQSSENGIEGCSENIIEEKTAEVSNLLDMMRSASTVEGKKLNSCETTADPEWKLKQDNEELRVMYREGPQGTPFHMLLAEGYVDGPADVCLCISWESELYKKWWPQSTVPTFKILSAKCVEKVRIGEQISLVRMKVPWPLSAREAVVHYFMFEYFQEDLIVVLLKSISDLESIDGAKDAVRIDLVGGFALQKVNKERSYFRTIASMDIKMDFVPPSLINFISRQLIGNGFKLYQKVVCSTANSDEDYSKALSGPLYTKIREALFKLNESNNALDENKLDTDTSNLPEEPEMRNKMKGLDLVDMDQKVENDDPESDAAPDDAQVRLASEVAPDGAQFTGRSTFGEIEEVESDESGKLEGQIESDESEKIEDQVSNRVEETGCSNGKRNVVISSEVEQALEMLEKVISKVRQNGLNARIRSSSDFIQEVPRNENGGVYPKENDGVEAKSLEVGVCASDEHFIDVPLTDLVEKALPKSVKNPSVLHSTSYAGSNSLSKEVNHNRIVPTSLEQELFVSCESDQAAFYSSKDGTAEVTVLDHILHDTNHINSKTNGTHEIAQGRMKKSRKHRKHRYCCFGLNSRQVDFEEVGRS